MALGPDIGLRQSFSPPSSLLQSAGAGLQLLETAGTSTEAVLASGYYQYSTDTTDLLSRRGREYTTTTPFLSFLDFIVY